MKYLARYSQSLIEDEHIDVDTCWSKLENFEPIVATFVHLPLVLILTPMLNQSFSLSDRFQTVV